MAKKNYEKMTSQQLKAEKKSRLIKSWKKQDRLERREKGLNILNIVVIAMLAISLIGILKDGSILTLNGFLEFLSTCPKVGLDFLKVPMIEAPSWGIFSAIAEVLNFFIQAQNALGFVLMAIVNALLMVLWFLRYVFL